MQRTSGAILAAALMLAALAATGCSSIRGIPTHGGGKRFDEEERIVSGSIRRSIADMDLKELRGRTVMLVLESISHSGGGYMTFPGVTNLSGNWSKINATSAMNYARIPIIYVPFMDYLSDNDSESYGASASYSPNPSFNSAVLGTDADLNYLRAALTMKAQHSGLTVVPASPDVVLFVLVDVLGLNRSRRDSLVFWIDNLISTCELTYYALDAKTNQLVFPARAAAAQGLYREYSLVGFTAYKVMRELESTPHTSMPFDGDEASSGPATRAKVKTKNGRKAPAPMGDQSVSEFLKTQLLNAQAQMEGGGFDQAQAHLSTIRAIDPNYPGLAEADNRLQYLRQTKKP